MNKELYDEAIRSGILSRKLIEHGKYELQQYLFYQLDCRST